jgi:hypothetical protein
MSEDIKIQLDAILSSLMEMMDNGVRVTSVTVDYVEGEITIRVGE